MGVLRLLLLIAAVVLVYFVLKSFRRSLNKPPAPGAKVEDMVRCEHCGVNLPRSEALLSRGRFFCSEEHRRLSQS
jgi:uncharacterized protein